MKVLTFKCSAFSGDIIYLLSAIKYVCEKHRTQADLYMWLNRPWGDSVEGQKHPYGISEYAFNMLKPLIEAQPYMASFQKYEGQHVAVDLDQMRTEKHSTMPSGSIMRWPGQIWPDMQPDSSIPWIEVPYNVGTISGISLEKSTGKVIDSLPMDKIIYPVIGNETKGKILINRTARWRNDFIHYWCLREIQDQLIFAGLREEHDAFCKEWELDIPLLKVDDFLELAVAIKSCRYFIGNQSLCFALAEAMKTPRLLEVCRYAPNVQPTGPHGYDFIHQFALEWFVKDKDSPLNKL